MSGDGSADLGAGLPSGWCWARIADVADVQLGKMLDQAKHLVGDPMPYLRNVSVRWDRIDTHDLPTMLFTTPEQVKYSLLEGDILVCEGGEPGRCAIWTTDAKVLYQKALHRVRVRGSVEPRWILYCLRYMSWFGLLSGYLTGTTIRHLPAEKLSAIEHAVPPIGEQRRIVAKLDDLLARSRATREALAAVLPLLERYRESVLATAFRGDLTEGWRLETGSSSDWLTVRLGEVLKDVRYGTSKKCHYEPVDVPVLRIPNVASGFISREDMKYASFDEAEQRQLALLPGDILMIRSNGSLGLVGRTAVVTERDGGLLYAGYLIRLRVNMGLANSQYLSLYLGAPGARSDIERTSRSTTGVNNINAEEIRNITVSLPPLPEQQEIVRRVDAAFARIAAVRALVEAQLARLDALDRSILARAFRGELVPQDPSDEPASALLDRIRAERAAAPAKASPRGRPAAR